VGDLREPLEVGRDERRVRDRFDVDERGVVVDRVRVRPSSSSVDESGLDSAAVRDAGEVRGRAAVHLGTGDDVVARAREHGRYRVERGHPRAGRDRVGAARQVGDPVFEDAHGRVGEPGSRCGPPPGARTSPPPSPRRRRRTRSSGGSGSRARSPVGLGAGVETPGVEPTCHVCSAYIYKHL